MTGWTPMAEGARKAPTPALAAEYKSLIPWGTEYKFLNCYYIWLKQPPKLVSSLSKTIVHGPVGTGLVITSLVITTSKIQSQEKVEKWNT